MRHSTRHTFPTLSSISRRVGARIRWRGEVRVANVGLHTPHTSLIWYHRIRPVHCLGPSQTCLMIWPPFDCREICQTIRGPDCILCFIFICFLLNVYCIKRAKVTKQAHPLCPAVTNSPPFTLGHRFDLCHCVRRYSICIRFICLHLLPLTQLTTACRGTLGTGTKLII